MNTQLWPIFCWLSIRITLGDNSFVAVSELYCQNKGISTIQKTDFNDEHIENLYLDRNTISSVEIGSFKGTNLRVFQAANNQLTKIPDFHEVRDTLLSIELYNNSITIILREEIIYLTKIYRLSLENNPLEHVLDFPRLLPSLEYLNLKKVGLNCDSSIVWLKRIADDFQVEMDDAPCRSPPEWTTTPWANITEEMLLQRPSVGKNGI
ncbi:hypothetical protein CAPTEDRAFT_212693 [Capitella teleta]|uniref:LRRCT domain-containing protein n=1 Tax=Capitella teleta TaxID=283909 RepID=R7UJ47_CAPTE|nr:hypothetical protein CAPTEDRAFT_212693 [Capitella teleta]|eukprot:ELU06098.1 hypothetical protein CAPTEDRAFT_212693 [Capitella teleta]